MLFLISVRLNARLRTSFLELYVQHTDDKVTQAINWKSTNCLYFSHNYYRNYRPAKSSVNATHVISW